MSFNLMNKLPQAKNTDILTMNAGNELLVYDLITDKAYNLNETSRIVFESCDGKTTFDELKSKYKFTDDLIYLSLDQLKAENLIAGEYRSKFADVSRREIIKKIGLASVIALPLIASLVAPTAVSAQSCPTTGKPNGCACTTMGSCTSGCCSSSPRTCVTPGQKAAGTRCIANCECSSNSCTGSPQTCQ